MKIRSVTCFIPLSWPFADGTIISAARLLTDARHRLSNAGFEVQSVGVATPPFLDVLGYPDPALLLEYALRLDDLARHCNLDFISIGPVTAATPLSLLLPIHALPKIITQTERIVSGVLFADAQSGVNLAAAHALAHSVLEIAAATPNGSGNLRLGALANVPAHRPHLPAAYHQGSVACFALATEAADLAVSAVNNARSLNDVPRNLGSAIEGNCAQILKIVDGLVDDHQIEFGGLDFALTPFPQPARSIGAAVERLGITAFGGHGTLFALSVLATALRAVTLPRVVFSGIMLPVLGDSIISQRQVSLDDLLLYAAVCGGGIDLAPLPGAAPADELAAIYLDVAALALATGHPFSARLLPIPYAQPGDNIELDMPNLAGSAVLPLKNLGSAPLFERHSFFALKNPKPAKKR